MDENSCEGETSKIGGEKPVEGEEESIDPEKENNGNFILEKKNSSDVANYESGIEAGGNESMENQVSESCAASSSCDPSGPSFSLSPPVYEGPQSETESVKELTTLISAVPVASSHNDRPHVRIAQDALEQSETRRNSIGPPPSYSFVMKQKRKGQKTSTSDIVTDRPPPPTYAGIRGLYSPPETEDLNRMCILPSFQEPIWRSHSQPAYCPRCGILVLTTTHSHESVATHVAALALCLLGCWPCCFLPYCMNVCKNTYHHCPVCQAYLGSYTPW